MADKKDIYKMVDDTLNSMDHHSRAVPHPYLLTRIKARLHNQPGLTGWEWLVSIITRPVVAMAGLATIIVVNILIISSNSASSVSNISQQDITDAQGFSIPTTTALYDIENIEP